MNDHFYLLHFLFAFFIVVSLSLIEAIAKSFPLIFAIAFQSENEQQLEQYRKEAMNKYAQFLQLKEAKRLKERKLMLSLSHF